MGIMEACGLKPQAEVRGDAFLSRYADDDDMIWKRLNLTSAECTSDSAWVVASADHNKGRTVSGSSLSSILSQQAAAMQVVPAARVRGSVRGPRCSSHGPHGRLARYPRPPPPLASHASLILKSCGNCPLHSSESPPVFDHCSREDRPVPPLGGWLARRWLSVKEISRVGAPTPRRPTR